jgi:hypothetical protein
MSRIFRYTFGNKKNEKQIITKMLEEIDLEVYQKEYLQGRFIDILYDDFDLVAIKNKIAFQILRLTALVAGVLVPIVANLNDNIVLINLNKTALITILGILSSISYGFLQLFQNEKVWLHHRETFEILRTEGYKFLNLAGQYGGYNSHKLAYPHFANILEELIKMDIKAYSQLLDKREKNI